MTKKGIFKFAAFIVALFSLSSAAAQNETVVTLAGNAYITAGSSASIDEGR